MGVTTDACFCTVNGVNFKCKTVVIGCTYYNDLSQSLGVTTLLGALKTGFGATFHVLSFDKYAMCCLDG